MQGYKPDRSPSVPDILLPRRLISTPDWWNIADDGAIEIAGDRRISLWIAAPRNTIWRLEAIDPDGAVIPDAILQWSAELMPMFE